MWILWILVKLHNFYFPPPLAYSKHTDNIVCICLFLQLSPLSSTSCIFSRSYLLTSGNRVKLRGWHFKTNSLLENLMSCGNENKKKTFFSIFMETKLVGLVGRKSPSLHFLSNSYIFSPIFLYIYILPSNFLKYEIYFTNLENTRYFYSKSSIIWGK